MTIGTRNPVYTEDWLMEEFHKVINRKFHKVINKVRRDAFQQAFMVCCEERFLEDARKRMVELRDQL